MNRFNLVTDYTLKGDQPKAVNYLAKNISEGKTHQVLLGVTGSGKTFTMANIINKVQKPAVIIAHNKTLAAQLYNEFKYLFPDNAVEYFISYYDYYQPEAYLPQTDTYIEKDSSINDEIDKLRHSATRSLLERDDVIIVASVSCIYGLGSPSAYEKMHVFLAKGVELDRDNLLKRLIAIQYERNDIDFKRGSFRVRGDIVEIIPAYEDAEAIRIEFFGDFIDNIYIIDSLRGTIITEIDKTTIHPASHYVAERETIKETIKQVKKELTGVINKLEKEKKFIETQRIEERTMYDMEMLNEIGYCKGIENYSRYLTGRKPGEPPPTLLDFFREDFLVFIDESHATVPQIRGMFFGDRSRKENLIRYGFRLPSALDNRPLNFKEVEDKIRQVVFVSATPAEYELNISKGLIAEQIVRPTGLIDPEIIIKPVKNQVDDLINEIKARADKDERILVTTLTKRFSENLTEYLLEMGCRVKYLHSDIDTLKRTQIIKELRQGKFDAIVGINLLREGLDIPEVSLVAILDADKEGFLRSETSLIQTCGRAARNINGTVIFYADKITRSIKKTMDETARRRKIQLEYNKKNNILPESVKKNINDTLSAIYEKDYYTVPEVLEDNEEYRSIEDIEKEIGKLKRVMLDAAKELKFEKAAAIRDKIRSLTKSIL